MGKDKTLDQYVQKLMVNRHKVMEQRIRTVLRPKPKWLPKPIWNWLISKLIYLEQEELRNHDKGK